MGIGWWALSLSPNVGEEGWSLSPLKVEEDSDGDGVPPKWVITS